MYNTTASAPRGGLSSTLGRIEGWLDDRGKGAWIAAMILGFVFIWPIGLALLAYLIWSKRMFSRANCGNRHAHSHGFGKSWGHHHGGARPSGNTAFDAYKSETLRRLEEEQDAFEAFLDRLRQAKDKSEFDAFMDDRARAAAQGAPVPPAPPAPPASPRVGEY